MAWRYIAQRIAGSSKGLFLDMNLPLRDVEITDAEGPNWMAATVSPELRWVKAEDGRPLLDKWSTAIWAEEGGKIRGGGILADSVWNGQARSLQIMGYAGYPKGMPYLGTYSKIGVDTFDVVRHVWDHVQSYADGDLGMVIDAHKSGVPLGTKDQPYTLDWWESPDCGAVVDDLSGSTPFGYREHHAWNADKTDVTHRLQLAYPRLGKQQDNLRFVLGENIIALPDIEDAGEDFANSVLGLGAGTGRKMVRGYAAVRDGRLRRVTVENHKGVGKQATMDSRVNSRLKALRQNDLELGSITVEDHPNARIGAWSPGDDILVSVDTGSVKFHGWCRVKSTTIRPEASNVATITIEAL